MDNILLAVFGTLSFTGILFGLVATWMAFRGAKKKQEEIGMALWAVGALAGFSVGGMALAYFVIPILLHHASR